jgi:hypothetical protein
LELRVHKVQQAASGGSHVTIYEADVEFVSGSAGVQVLGSEPRDGLPGCYQQAVESIRKRAEQVLGPLGVGAVIRIGRIVLHPVDFKPRKFELYTAEELRRLVEQSQVEPGATPDPGGIPSS